MRDVLPANAAGSGDVVSVTVTPTDGNLNGGSGSGEITITCPGDFTGDGHVGVNDILTVVSYWGNPYGVNDVLSVMDHWGPCR